MNANLKAASNFVKLGFAESFDDLDKLASELSNATSDPETPGAEAINIGGASKPVQQIETTNGVTDIVPSHIKKLMDEVAAVKADSTNGPTKIEGADTTLKGDIHASIGSSGAPAKPISDVVSENEVESEKKANLITDILTITGYIN